MYLPRVIANRPTTTAYPRHMHWLVMAILLLTAPILNAEELYPADEELITSLDTPSLKAFLSDYTNGQFEEDGDAVYHFKMLGCNTLLWNDGHNLQLYAGFIHPGISLEQINAWNLTHRFSRAYLDKDLDPVLESDLELQGGSTVGSLREFLHTFELSLAEFTRHIDWRYCGR